MKKNRWTRDIRRDCLHFMRGATVTRFFLDITSLIAPTVSAWLIGDMADALLLVDRAGIGRRLPPFLLALALTVLGVPLLQLLENLLLTENGFAYDRYLVGRYLRLPLSQTQTYSLQMRGITFSYPGETKRVLENVSFDLPAGKNLWLRGGNGCGKSTLAAVLCGLYPPAGGQIRTGSGGALSVADLRRLTAYQEQEGAIFSGTIADNLFAPHVSCERQRRLLESLGLRKPLDFPVEA